MDSREFLYFRRKLEKTQKQMAQLLGTSIKTVRSYEQGWRTVPTHIERQVFYLAFLLKQSQKKQKPCWIIKKCPPHQKKQCPAWEFQSGKLCWFINGTICEGSVQNNWQEKIKICRSCEMLEFLF